MSVAVNRVVFTTGGTVQAGGGAYLPRRADGDLLALCRQSQFAYVLTARQMGKSSLMVRTVEQLSEENVRAVMIDLTQIGTQVTPEQWYLGLLAIIEEQLLLDADAVAWWQANGRLGFTQRLTNFFQEVLLKEIAEPVVIFVDEIDTTLSLDFTDDFYAAIRYLYNARATMPEFKRLSFVLIGVATPGDLIRDKQRTPFNIGQRVDLADFTADEALPLATGLSLPPDEAAPVLGWMMKWTNGHPYLTQRLCLALVDQRRPHWTEAEVDRVVANTFFGAMSEQDNNLSFVRDMLTKRAPDVEGVLTTYQEVRSGKRPVRDEEQSIVKSHLKLSGVVNRAGVGLLVRNRIYETVFDEHWVRDHLPTNWRKRFRYAAAALLAAFIFLSPAIGVYAWKNKDLTRINTQLEETNRQLESANVRLRLAVAEASKARDDEAKQRASADENADLAKANAAEAEQQQLLAQGNAKEAERQRNLAQSRELAANATLQASLDPDLSLSLVNQSLSVAYTSQGEDALRDYLRQRPIELTLRGHNAPVNSAAFSPDGRFIATGGNDYKARIWNTTSGQLVAELDNPAPAGAVSSAAYSPDGRFIVTAYEAGTARVWNVASRQVVAELKSCATNASYSPDGRFIVTASGSIIGGSCGRRPKTAQIWNAADGQLIRELRGHADSVVDAAYSPDGRFIVTASDDGTARIWNAASGQVVAELKRHKSSPFSVAYSPDGRFIVTSGGMVRVWNAASGQVITELKGHAASARSASYSPDGRFIVTASRDGTVRVWNATSGQVVAELKGHTDSVNNVAYSSDGCFIVTASEDGTARVWKAVYEQVAAELKDPEASVMGATYSSVRSATYSPDGRFILTSAGFTTRVWNPANGQIVAELRGNHELEKKVRGIARVNSAVYSPDGRFILTANDDWTAKVWNADSEQVVSTLEGHVGGVTSAIYSPDGRFIFTGSQGYGLFERNASARIWDAASGQVVDEFEGFALVKSAAYSPDGRFIVICGGNWQAWVCNLANGQITELKGHASSVNSVAYSPDGCFIVTTSVDRTARVWIAATARLITELKGHADSVNSAAYSPDGRFIVTASADHTARVWNAVTGQMVAELKGHAAPLVSAAYSPDGHFIVTGSDDGTARIWPQEMFEPFEETLKRLRRLAPRELTPEERERYLHEPPSKRPPTALR